MNLINIDKGFIDNQINLQWEGFNLNNLKNLINVFSYLQNWVKPSVETNPKDFLYSDFENNIFVTKNKNENSPNIYLIVPENKIQQKTENGELKYVMSTNFIHNILSPLGFIDEGNNSSVSKVFILQGEFFVFEIVKPT